MGKSSSTNRPVIAGRRLEWTSWKLRWHLLDERGRTLYEIERLYGEHGALHDPVTDFGFQYKVTVKATGEELGVETYLPCAKYMAEQHFAKENNGKHEGYWTSEKLTRQAGELLRQQGR